MPPSRPYIQKSAKELEALFESVKTDLPTVKLILAELKHRSTPSAHALRDKVEKQLKSLSKPREKETSSNKANQSEPEKPTHHIVNCKGCGTKIRIPIKDARIAYQCPKCELPFEAEYRGGVMEIVFLKEDAPINNQENITEESARSILGVSARASFAEIKAAWRKLSQQYHPDKHQNLPERLRKAAEVEMRQINSAYQILARVSAEEF